MNYKLKRLYSILLLLSCCTLMAVAADRKFTLVIDAGHGGKDAGTCTKKSKEKNIALKTALAFGRYVEQNCPDVKVVYTRKTDVFVKLNERADIANKNHADLFVSIHVNSVESKRPVTGIEVYSMGLRASDQKLSAAQRENDVILLEDNYQQFKGYDPNSTESKILYDIIFDQYMENSVEFSALVQKRLKAIGRPGRVKQDNFAVLRLTASPACLVELGYITTPSEEQYMNADANLDKMAHAIYLAFLDYRKKFSGAAPQPSSQEVPQEASTAPQGQPHTSPKGGQDTLSNQEKHIALPSEGSGEGAVSEEAPIFKVQLFVGKQKLKKGDKQLKGIDDFDYYEEGGYLKYTTGASADYNEIARLRRQVADRFPEAFVIAFKNGQRMDVQQAIREFKSKR